MEIAIRAGRLWRRVGAPTPREPALVGGGASMSRSPATGATRVQRPATIRSFTNL